MEMLLNYVFYSIPSCIYSVVETVSLRKKICCSNDSDEISLTQQTKQNIPIPCENLDDDTTELIVSGYTNQFCSNENKIKSSGFFGGAVPSEVIKICTKYLHHSNQINIDREQYLSINDEYEYVSSPYCVHGAVFQTIIGIEKVSDNEYETNIYVQLLSLPTNVSSVTIHFELLASEHINLWWKNIRTMRCSDIVHGAPSVTTKNIIELHEKNLFFTYIDVFLMDGKPKSHF